MFNSKSSFKPLVFAALVVCAGASQAAFISTFTTLSAFNASTTLQGTDLYTGLSITGTTASPLVVASKDQYGRWRAPTGQMAVVVNVIGR